VRAPEFWARDGILPTLLSPLAALWAAGGALREATTLPWRAPVRVLCVGNLVAGGAGKTPVVLSLARLLMEHGRRPHLISRGYGGGARGPLRVDPARHEASEVGDEPLLLARAAPCWVGADRRAAAEAAIAAGAELLVMDDGLQNPALAKDLSLVVVDGTYRFGNGRVIPAGPLREPVERGLARADAVVLIGDGDVACRPPVLHARLAPIEPNLAGHRVLAFAGIGRPEKFFATCRDAGAELAATRAFADHHRYTEAELRALLDHAASLGATLLTTEKDAVRLPPALRARVAVLRVAVEWREPEKLLGALTPVMLSRSCR
jgi:tetraacyldisaccharide 4'-kinase